MTTSSFDPSTPQSEGVAAALSGEPNHQTFTIVRSGDAAADLINAVLSARSMLRLTAERSAEVCEYLAKRFAREAQNMAQHPISTAWGNVEQEMQQGRITIGELKNEILKQKEIREQLAQYKGPERPSAPSAPPELGHKLERAFGLRKE